ncbi:type II toxin-antitoxin system death-on-curing family toxin [Photobacterium sp. WH24]|uniref:type II toxin-antitoxin system death-on-curing family toxin n=1 Tax=Photobacterium sp. WH24 TaxID=2827237 RepID=UPI001C496F89|nr:type II toxin-antitoxin system death-on-curing family toxin [Photobacterium sp. WH24]MBV7262570.1 type II toxin-antitoxin system death-on-curing family toxin [Photobacterium sp. WH24]
MKIEQIKFIHEYLVEYFRHSEDPVSPPGIKNEELLESAVTRPFMSAGGNDAYVGVFNKAAALFHSVINNHCFHNGNKRAALLSSLVYLGDNGWWITIPEDEELFEFTRKAAAHELAQDRNDELGIIANYFQVNTRRRQAGEHQLTLRDLREILYGFGYELSDRVDGRTIDITKNGIFVTSILQKGSKGKENYDKKYIRKLRRQLKLTPEYGVDSYEFYGNKGFSDTLSKYMRMRDKVMRELAKI